MTILYSRLGNIKKCLSSWLYFDQLNLISRAGTQAWDGGVVGKALQVIPICRETALKDGLKIYIYSLGSPGIWLMSETKPHSGPIKSQCLRASRMPASASVSFSSEPTCSLDKEGALGLDSGLCFLGARHKASPPSSMGQVPLLRVPMMPCPLHSIPSIGCSAVKLLYFLCCYSQYSHTQEPHHETCHFSYCFYFYFSPKAHHGVPQQKSGKGRAFRGRQSVVKLWQGWWGVSSQGRAQ